MKFFNSTYDSVNETFLFAIRGNTNGIVFMSILIVLLWMGICAIILALRSACLYFLHCECLRDSSNTGGNRFPIDSSSRSTDGFMNRK
jgi:hypothetical protein